MSAAAFLADKSPSDIAIGLQIKLAGHESMVCQYCKLTSFNVGLVIQPWRRNGQCSLIKSVGLPNISLTGRDAPLCTCHKSEHHVQYSKPSSTNIAELVLFRLPILSKEGILMEARKEKPDSVEIFVD
jgi:hypothetical protein